MAVVLGERMWRWQAGDRGTMSPRPACHRSPRSARRGAANHRRGCVVRDDACGGGAAGGGGAGEVVGPLHGVPVTVKDWIDVEGFPCAGAFHRDRRPGAIGERPRVDRVRETAVWGQRALWRDATRDRVGASGERRSSPRVHHRSVSQRQRRRHPGACGVAVIAARTHSHRRAHGGAPRSTTPNIDDRAGVGGAADPEDPLTAAGRRGCRVVVTRGSKSGSGAARSQSGRSAPPSSPTVPARQLDITKRWGRRQPVAPSRPFWDWDRSSPPTRPQTVDVSRPMSPARDSWRRLHVAGEPEHRPHPDRARRNASDRCPAHRGTLARRDRARRRPRDRDRGRHIRHAVASAPSTSRPMQLRELNVPTPPFHVP